MKFNDLAVLRTAFSGKEDLFLGYMPVIRGNNGKYEKNRFYNIYYITLSEQKNPILKKRSGGLKW